MTPLTLEEQWQVIMVEARLMGAPPGYFPQWQQWWDQDHPRTSTWCRARLVSDLRGWISKREAEGKTTWQG
jgi:hypothetical protein